jgi:hypothetical protein
VMIAPSTIPRSVSSLIVPLGRIAAALVAICSPRVVF